MNDSQEIQLIDRIKVYMDMGDLYYYHGYLADAFKTYMKTEELVTSSEQLVQICLKSVLINLERCHFDNVLKYVDMAERSLGPLDTVTVAKLHVVAGLAHLGKRQYRMASLKFLETGPELGSNYSEVILPVDVAMYGAVCALASFDSSEMKIKVMENVTFGSYLNLQPQVHQLVHDFFHGQHKSCMDHLQNLKPRLLLDIHLGDHVETLYFVISQKSGYMVVSGFEDIFNTASPIQNEEIHEENETQNVVVSNLVLPSEFDDESCLLNSPHYKFFNAKELLFSLRKNSGWVSRLNSQAVLINATLFVRDSVRDEDERFDGRIAVVSDARLGIFEVRYSSYTSTQKALKETRIKDKEDSIIDRFQIKGNIWTRRRTCLKNDHSFHILQWRKTSGLRRAQVRSPEAAAGNISNTQLNDTMKALIEHLKDHTNALTQTEEALTQTRNAVVELTCSLAEARKTAATTATGDVAT